MSDKIKVLIIDDSKLVREVLTSIFNASDELSVVGAAEDPYQAREMIKQYRPDVLTVDVEMPKMNGISFLRNLMRLNPLPVVMVSTLTSEGSNITLQALELGAIDFIEKPKDLTANLQEFSQHLVSKVAAAASVSRLKLLSFQTRLKMEQNTPAAEATAVEKLIQGSSGVPAQRVIAIGGSTGGLEAVRHLLTNTRFSGKETLLICLHLPGGFTQSYAKRLDQVLPVTVKEAEHGERLLQGHIYIAPGTLHMAAKKRNDEWRILLDDGERVSMHKPSVDVLFDSVAKYSDQACMGILLTGMGRDGADGLLNLKNMGAMTIAQDEESSIVWGMPGQAVKEGAAQKVLSLDEIPRYIQAFRF